MNRFGSGDYRLDMTADDMIYVAQEDVATEELGNRHRERESSDTRDNVAQALVDQGYRRPGFSNHSVE
ncbi:MAG: hypothetical protein ACREOZ_01740 [Gloeomargaritales cyanobacterium]